ncbi:MAG TPA: hypothetical protein VL134_06115 [Leptolyngbya sp.]|nr:hypothetical protein [Leptolyngbya sp.]
MLDLNLLFEFSRMNCVGICAFLVPANILTTLFTLVLTALGRPSRQILLAAGMASLFSGIMVLHVLTWFLIGVVMMPTYILLGLGSLCLLTNLISVFRHKQIKVLLNALMQRSSRIYTSIGFARQNQPQ